MPVPKLNLKPIEKKYDQLGDGGILRGFVWGDQAGCWQHAACLYDITDLIMATFEKPVWVHVHNTQTVAACLYSIKSRFQ